MGFDRSLHLRKKHSHVSRKCCTRLVELHDFASSVMLALPGDIIRDRLVRSKTEWLFVLPHLSCHVVPPSQFNGKTVSVCVENKTTDSAEVFFHKELDFGIGGSHCVLRNLYAHGVLHNESEPIVNPPCRNLRAAAHSLSTEFQQQSTKHSRDTLLLKMSNTSHTAPDASLS